MFLKKQQQNIKSRKKNNFRIANLVNKYGKKRGEEVICFIVICQPTDCQEKFVNIVHKEIK